MINFTTFGEHTRFERHMKRLSIFLLAIIVCIISMPLGIVVTSSSYTVAESIEDNTSTNSDSVIEESIKTSIIIDLANTIVTREFDTFLEFIDIDTSDDILEETDIESEVITSDDEIESNSESEIEEPIVETQVEYNTYFTAYTDIGKGMSGVTAEMLDAYTKYNSRYQSFTNEFLNNGWIFIEAQEKSGIDALWLYAVSAFESGWGSSRLARTRHNYFGIGAWDIDLNRTKYMGDSIYAGIINGAVWISEHYYEAGQTNMYLMNYTPGHSYAPGNDVWIPKIANFINKFYKFREENLLS